MNIIENVLDGIINITLFFFFTSIIFRAMEKLDKKYSLYPFAIKEIPEKTISFLLFSLIFLSILKITFFGL